MLVVVVIVQFEFKFHFINLPQPPASREASAALSRSLSRCSLPHSCTALHALSDICLLAPAACDCVRHSPTAFSALLCMHSLIAVRFICLRRLVRLTLTQPSGCLRSLSAAACAECAIDLGDIDAGVVDIVSRLRTFNANARGICSRSTRLASFAAAAASASAE